MVKGKPITSPDSKSLADLIKPLRNQGIVTNVIGIGPGLDASDLTNIVQRPENILFVDDLNDLQTDVERMWKHIGNSFYAVKFNSVLFGFKSSI